MENFNFLDAAASESDGKQSGPELIRLHNGSTAIVPITANGKVIELHWAEYPDVTGYFRCNGPDCVFCKVGASKKRQFMLPVWRVDHACIGVLSGNAHKRPRALVPQLCALLLLKQPMVIEITERGGGYFDLRQLPLPQDMLIDAHAIKNFLSKYEADGELLTSLYGQVDNETLRTVPEIARLLKVKEVGGGAGN